MMPKLDRSEEIINVRAEINEHKSKIQRDKWKQAFVSWENNQDLYIIK